MSCAGKPLCAGQGELDQIDKIVGVLGTPTEADWPNLKSLPNWGKVVLKQVKDGVEACGVVVVM